MREKRTKAPLLLVLRCDAHDLELWSKLGQHLSTCSAGRRRARSIGYDHESSEITRTGRNSSHDGAAFSAHRGWKRSVLDVARSEDPSFGCFERRSDAKSGVRSVCVALCGESVREKLGLQLLRGLQARRGVAGLGRLAGARHRLSQREEWGVQAAIRCGGSGAYGYSARAAAACVLTRVHE
jgi:hypothetical protein